MLFQFNVDKNFYFSVIIQNSEPNHLNQNYLPILQSQRGRGYWALYYTCSQSFYMFFIDGITTLGTSIEL